MCGRPNSIMNSLARVLTTLALALTASSVFGQAPATSPRIESLRVARVDSPVFPRTLLQEGVRDGNVRLAISVDESGKIEDALAIAYTDVEFARVTLASLKNWVFEPARVDGRPTASATEIEVNFEVEGTVVVSMTTMDSIALRFASLYRNNPEAYRPRALSELDRIPTPISTPSPVVPESLRSSASSSEVTVSFYIDEQGAVRLPSVDVSQDTELAASAISALRNWKFEPPTRHNRPVLVRALQQFKFRPAATTASGSRKG